MATYRNYTFHRFHYYIYYYNSQLFLVFHFKPCTFSSRKYPFCIFQSCVLICHPLRLYYVGMMTVTLSGWWLQILLLEKSWRDMFLISFSQSNTTLDWSQVFMDAAAGRPWMTSAEVTSLSSHAGQVSDFVQRLRHMELDVTEYTCLKALVLFRPGNTQCRPPFRKIFSF